MKNLLWITENPTNQYMNRNQTNVSDEWALYFVAAIHETTGRSDLPFQQAGGRNGSICCPLAF